MAGTLLASFDNLDNDIEQRRFAQIILRSLLENFYWILYIYDDNAKRDARFEEYLDGFKIQYRKLLADSNLPRKNELEPADPAWSSLKNPMDLNSVLAQVRNAYGNRLDHLYFTYRITSFDTHGKSLQSLFKESFGAPCDFPHLKVQKVVDLMAGEYLFVWGNIRRAIPTALAATGGSA